MRFVSHRSGILGRCSVYGSSFLALLGFFWIVAPAGATLPEINDASEFPYEAGHYCSTGVGYYTNDAVMAGSEPAANYDYHDSSVVYSAASSLGAYASVAAWSGMGWSKNQIVTTAELNCQDVSSATNPFFIGRGNVFTAWADDITIQNAEHNGESGVLHATVQFHGVRSSNWPSDASLGNVALSCTVGVQESSGSWSYNDFSAAPVTTGNVEFSKTVTVDIPFTFGQTTRYVVGSEVDVGSYYSFWWDTLPIGVTVASSSLDMMNTITWQGVTGIDLVDAEGNSIGSLNPASVDMQAVSGVNWLAPVTASAVPEPSSLGLLLTLIVTGLPFGRGVMRRVSAHRRRFH
ncbi:MAG: PEP-CTERM sorting domain-containing protein [Thermoguttaceae bacterium]